MTGWLVVNEFLLSNKFNEIHAWLLEAAKKQNIELRLKTNAELLIDLSEKCGVEINRTSDFVVTDVNINRLKDVNTGVKKDADINDIRDVNIDYITEINASGNSSESKVDFVLFWDKDIRLALHLEQLGYPVFNSSKAIGICDDKSLTHLALMKAGIKMPRTIVAPMTYPNVGFTNLTFLEEVAERIGFPMVIKECFGSFGQQVYLAKDLEELKVKVIQLGAKPILFQEYIASSFGKDLRLQVVGKEVIASMYRYSENGDFRANLTIGGKMKAYTPTKEQCELALRSCEIIGLDFAGVDLLFGENEEPIVCEVNSNAHFKNIYDCTGVNVADAIISYIKQKINL